MKYITRPDWRMRSDMDKAPVGKKLLLINEGGVLVQGVLTNANRAHFVEWSELPKRASKQCDDKHT